MGSLDYKIMGTSITVLGAPLKLALVSGAIKNVRFSPSNEELN